MRSRSQETGVRSQKRLLTALLAISSVAFPQQPQTVFPLETLAVKGNQRLKSEKIIEVSGLKIGAPVTKADFDAARARLLSTGAFESVGYEYKPAASNKGYAGTLDVIEVEQLFPYRFEEIPVPDDQLRTALRKQELILGDEIPASKDVLDRYTAVIQKLAGASVKVISKVDAESSHYVIVFRPDTPRSRVAEVRFTGNQVIPTEALLRAAADVAFGTAYSEPLMRAILDASVRPLYDARGRIRVAFTKIETERAQNYDGVIVKVTVDEGQSYSLGAVNFAGVSRDDARELQRLTNLQPNDVVNFDDIKAALDKVYPRYRSKGYLHVAANIERSIDDAVHRVDVTIKVDPGPQFVMGKLEIKGLDILSEPPIRKVWNLREGAPYDPQYPDAFLNDIRAQGVFDNLGKTKAEPKIDEKTHIVDVTLYFSGAAPEDQKKRGGRGRGGSEF